jgi:hypothetical protein
MTGAGEHAIAPRAHTRAKDTRATAKCLVYPAAQSNGVPSRLVDHGSKNRLMPQHAALFTGETVFDKLARAVCAAGVLPRKELYESWETARRVMKRVRAHEVTRVVDWACGHGLLAFTCALLSDDVAVVGYDRRIPPSSEKLRASLVAQWPRLARVSFVTRAPALARGDVVVSCHACGALTDEVIARALSVRAPVAVLPCCHDENVLDAGGLAGWMEPALAIDATRAARLRGAGYRVWTTTIPAEITPKNRLLVGVP